MERREDIQVKPGYEFDHYFPKAKLITITKKKGATVSDTLLLIPAVVRETLFHTKRFANEVIKADTLEKTCRNLWQFVTDHIAYKKDEDGKEQVRSPARAWHERHNTDEDGNPMGVDCDCYSVFISSVLSNLGIKHKLRITKYSANHFQHIYPIVPLSDGRYITIDCVVHAFDYEEPYTSKKDTDMDLEYLNGVSDPGISKSSSADDFMGIMDEQEALAELGKIFKRRSSGGSSGGGAKRGLFHRNTSGGSGTKKPGLFHRNTSSGGGKKKGKLKEFLKKGLHLTNRLNPAAATLRAGILAAMKLNFMKIGGQLRYTYLTEDQAKQKGLIMDRYHKMKSVREKLEKIFYGAGGKPENMKKAILTGHGNKNREVPVNGLGYVPYENTDHLHEDMPLSQLIGSEMYSDEMDGVHGLGELGEPVTAATIAAASTVLTTIVAMIKKVGSLFPKKQAAAGGGGNDAGGGGDSGGSDDGGGSGNDSRSGTSDSGTDNSSSSDNSSSDSSSSSDDGSGGGGDSGSNTSGKTANRNAPATTDGSNTGSYDGSDDGSDGSQNKSAAKTTSDPNAKPSFWDNNKKWIKPVGIGVGSLGLIALIYHVLKPKPKTKAALSGAPKKRKSKNLLNGLNGAPKKRSTHHRKKRSTKSKKKVVTLL